MRELSLFTGAGGGILGSHLLGWTPIGYVEWDEYCQRVLAQRVADGLIPRAPIFGDVREFVQSGAAREYRGFADVVSGGFPCQDISAASGTKTGLEGERSGMWHTMAECIRLIRPQYVFVENSPIITSRGLGTVLADLASMGFDARWGVFSGGDVGTRHERARMFIVANCDGKLGSPRPWSEQQFRQPANEPFCNGTNIEDCRSLWLEMADARAGMDDDVANRMDRTHAIGNGQIPCVAASAWRILAEG